MTERTKTFPLHVSVNFNNLEKVKSLLLSIKDINEKDEYGDPVFVKACQLDNGDEMFDLLLAQGNLDHTLTNDKGLNALHCLALKGNLRKIGKFLDKYPNFDVNARNNDGETALMLASGTNNVEIIEYLHAKGADIKAKNIHLSTVLHYAANGGYLEATDKLIQLGAEVNAENDEGHTPAAVASYWGWADICNILVLNGANLDSKDIMKPKGYHLSEAIVHRNVKKLGVLLNRGEEINLPDNEGYTPLMLACDQEVNVENKIIEMLLNQEGVDISLGDNEGKTPLHFLAYRGNLPAIRMLLERWPNFDVDVECEKGNTPLHKAVKMNQWEVVEFLINKGADIHHQNKKLFNVLHDAANNGAYESLVKLVELGADVNAKDDYGQTPLMRAANWGRLDICKYLIENGAEVNETSNLNMHALIHAAKRGNVEVVRFLLENGADPNQFSTAIHQTRSALGYACYLNNVEMVKLLIKFGANVNYPTIHGTPISLQSCVYSGSSDCVIELLNAGVIVNQRILNSAKKNKQMQVFELLQNHLLKKNRK